MIARRPDVNDPRTMRTDAHLRDAVVRLASQKSISDVTVAELTREAGIQRQTFYRHYGAARDVLEVVLRGELDTLREAERHRRTDNRVPVGASSAVAIEEVVAHIRMHERLYRLALMDPRGNSIRAVLSEHFRMSAQMLLDEGIAAPSPAALHGMLASYVADGLVGAIVSWLGADGLSEGDLITAVQSSLPVWLAQAE